MAQPSPGRPAVFMDRDGCLIEGMGYLNHPSRTQILARTAVAVSRLKPDHVAEDLLDAVEWALGRLEAEKGTECSR